MHKCTARPLARFNKAQRRDDLRITRSRITHWIKIYNRRGVPLRTPVLNFMQGQITTVGDDALIVPFYILRTDAEFAYEIFKFLFIAASFYRIYVAVIYVFSPIMAYHFVTAVLICNFHCIT